MSDDAAAQPVAAGHTRDIVRDASVEVVVTFPPILMSAAEAESLRSGYVLEIGTRLAQTELSVQIGGRQVATGKLVAMIEDHAGVMLDMRGK
jgi:flagellar motor switch protein FliM